ncbi:YtxH domain-containing protein [bacterium]|nr:YtxH domain-containing protein [bacterium]
MSDRNDIFEKGLVAGIIGGLIAGILFAPQSGEESRKKIKDAVNNFNDEHGDEIQDAKKKISVSYEILRYNIERQFRKLVNRTRARKLRKAKELEGDYEFN